MMCWSRWTCAALLALTLLTATARAHHYRTIVVTPPAPVVVTPVPVATYYTPAVSYYTPAPVVSYYTPAVTQSYYYTPAVVAPTVTSYRYGLFGKRQLDVVNYGAPAVVPVRSYYYTPGVILYP